MTTVTPYVFDASALLAFLKGETGGDVVKEILQNNPGRCFAHSINVCEVFYWMLRRATEKDAQASIRTLMLVGIIKRRDLGIAFWQQVCRHKVTLGHASLADCFCVTLAQYLNAELVTADHPDFDPVATLGICVVRFIR